jgi:hypothetical protein
MPIPLWGFFAGALLGVGLGVLIPDVTTAVFGAPLFGVVGAGLSWLGVKGVRLLRR